MRAMVSLRPFSSGATSSFSWNDLVSPLPRATGLDQPRQTLPIRKSHKQSTSTSISCEPHRRTRSLGGYQQRPSDGWQCRSARREAGALVCGSISASASADAETVTRLHARNCSTAIQGTLPPTSNDFRANGLYYLGSESAARSMLDLAEIVEPLRSSNLGYLRSAEAKTVSERQTKSRGQYGDDPRQPQRRHEAAARDQGRRRTTCRSATLCAASPALRCCSTRACSTAPAATRAISTATPCTWSTRRRG